MATTTKKTPETGETEQKKEPKKATAAKTAQAAKTAENATKTKRKTAGTSNSGSTTKTTKTTASKAAATKSESAPKTTRTRKNPAASAQKAKEASVAQETVAAPVAEVIEKADTAPVAEKEVTVMNDQPKKKILFVASECTPFIATGGLAEVIGSLSKTLAKDDSYDVRVMIPLYSDIKAKYRVLFQFIGNIYIPLAWRSQYCGVFLYEENNVKFYFIDNEYYFKRPGCYGYYDDGERFAFFSRSVMEVMNFIQFYPDIMHCHDWQAALAALYLKTKYCFRPEYQFIRSVFTIHNIEYQGKYSLDILEDLFDIPNYYRNYVEFDGCINLMKGAIEVSEKFSTVSPKYAEEIKDPYYAHGLESIIQRNEFKLCGILNGIDVDSYNPETDKALFANYNADSLEKKAICKEELQKMLNLPVRADVPMISMISRLVSHKGLDLVKTVIEDLLQEDVQIVILGTGDSEYENFFRNIASRYIGKMEAVISFNSDLARKIYSGSDMFLMPSKSEPCGLSQMIASRYATVPIVRETGGLYDSIKPEGNGGNGFTFAAYNAYDMLYVIRTALDCYRNKEYWNELMHRAISTDFSWDKSATEYKAMYNSVLNQ